jgi:hypothetical protein
VSKSSQEDVHSSSKPSCRPTANKIIPIILQRSVDEPVRYYTPAPSGNPSRLSTSAPLPPLPKRKHNSNSNNSGGSTTTCSVPEEENLLEDEELLVDGIDGDEVDGKSVRSASSASLSQEEEGSSSGSGSGSFSSSGSGSEDEEETVGGAGGIIHHRKPQSANNKAPDLSPTIPHRFDCSSSTYYSYYPDYRRSYQYQYQQQPPTVGPAKPIDCAGNNSRSRARSRSRSLSLDFHHERRELRRRRYSENEERAQDTSQTHKTYTIYESFIYYMFSLLHIVECIVMSSYVSWWEAI